MRDPREGIAPDGTTVSARAHDIDDVPADRRYDRQWCHTHSLRLTVRIPDGVELLEFRRDNSFNFVNLAKGAAFWEKAAEETAKRREGWKTAERPKLNV